MTPPFGEPSRQTGIATQGQIAPGDSNVMLGLCMVRRLIASKIF